MDTLESDPKVRTFLRLLTPILGVLLLAGVVVLLATAARLFLHPGHTAVLDNPLGGVLLLVAGLGVSIIAQRLLTGERGSDGGLLPRWLIVLGALLFLFAPVILYRMTGDLRLVVLTSALWGGVAASGFRVARGRREGQRE